MNSITYGMIDGGLGAFIVDAYRRTIPIWVVLQLNIFVIPRK